MVIPRTWIRKEVVFYLHWKTTRRMGQSRWIDDHEIRRKRIPSFPSHESSVPRNAQKQRRCGKLSIHFCADGETIETVFRTIISVNQLSIHAAVSDLCDEYRACQTRTGRPVAGRDNRTHCSSQQVCLWQHQHFRPKFLHKKFFCKSTKNEWKGSHYKTEWSQFVLMQDSWKQLKSDSISWRNTLKNFHSSQRQWPVVSTPCQETKIYPNQQGWVRGNTKIGPVLEVTTCCLQGKKYGVENRIESMNKDNSLSWVRISHGLNKLVTDLIDKEYDDNEQETSETKTEEFALKTQKVWSVNKLARSITKWTKACGRRLSRLISYIHHTCDYKQYCHVGNTAKQCILGLFQDSAFAGDLEDSKSTSGGTLCVFGSHTFVPRSWMCKKQTAVAHSSTESEIISLDTGLRLEGIVALDLWDLIVAVLHGNTYQGNEERGDLCTNLVRAQPHKLQTRKESHGMIDDLDNVDFLSSNVNSSRQGSFVVRVWRQRSSDQDDQKAKKPDNETCFQNPQSCSWLVVW